MSDPKSRRHSLGRVKAACQTLFAVLCVFYMCRWLLANWHTAQSAWTGLNWPQLLWAAVLLAISFLLLPNGTAIILRRQSAPIGYLGTALAYYGSQPAKYLPGSLWVYPSRVALLTQMGASLSTSVVAMLFETTSLLVSSALVGLAAINSVTTTSQPWLPVVACAGSVCVALCCLVLPEALHLLPLRRARASNTLRRLGAIPLGKRTVSLLLSILLYSAMWAIAGLSFRCMIAALSGGATVVPVSLAVSTFALAWLLGFVSIISPGGIGVREAAIAVILGTLIPPSQAALTALSWRVLWTIMELLYSVVSLLIMACIHRGPMRRTSHP